MDCFSRRFFLKEIQKTRIVRDYSLLLWATLVLLPIPMKALFHLSAHFFLDIDQNESAFPYQGYIPFTQRRKFNEEVPANCDLSPATA